MNEWTDKALLESEIERLKTELEHSDRRCKELSDLLPQMVYELDTHGRFTYLNKCGYQMFEYDCHDMEKGLSIKDVIVAADVDMAYAALGRILNGGKPTKGKRYMAKKKSGEVFPILIYTVSIHEGDKITGVRGICIDHTDHEAMIEELKDSQSNFKSLSIQYQFILDTIPDMVWTKDINNHFTFANKVMRSTLQKEADEILGKSLFDITEDVDDAVLTGDEMAKTLQTCHFIESFKVNGGEVWLDVTKAPIIQDGILVGTIGTARDISQKIENEKFLESYVTKEIEAWSKEQTASNGRIAKSLANIQSNIQRMRES